jgi:hypothetical protein
MVNESELEQALQSSWCRETCSPSSQPQWSPENPAWGQCAVTALVVQDYRGGDMVWATAFLPDDRQISHYFNLINGEEKDYTRQQYPVGTKIPLGISRLQGFATTRDYVLSNEDTVRRYELLKRRVEERLS